MLTFLRSSSIAFARKNLPKSAVAKNESVPVTDIGEILTTVGEEA